MEFAITSRLLDACVLSVVSEKDMYGYELTNKISSVIDISETALYPVLRRLMKDALLTSYDVQYDGRNRKYYSLTELGKEKFEYYSVEWKNHKEVVDLFLKRGEKNE